MLRFLLFAIAGLIQTESFGQKGDVYITKIKTAHGLKIYEGKVEIGTVIVSESNQTSARIYIERITRETAPNGMLINHIHFLNIDSTAIQPTMDVTVEFDEACEYLWVMGSIGLYKTWYHAQETNKGVRVICNDMSGNRFTITAVTKKIPKVKYYGVEGAL